MLVPKIPRLEVHFPLHFDLVWLIKSETPQHVSQLFMESISIFFIEYVRRYSHVVGSVSLELGYEKLIEMYYGFVNYH